MLRIEPIRDIIDGTPARGELVGARAGRGPELLLDQQWRESVLKPAMVNVLSHTQLRWDAINWIEVVGNWGMALPK